VKSVEGFEAALTAAKGKPVMLDFYADWCVSCKEMERDTFSVAAVRARLAQMVLLQVDVTVGTPEDQALLRRFQLFGPPGIVFFDARGQEVPQLRVIGFEAAAPFAATLDQVIAR
jgi:thiol:disulfide interchange protein DsbD